MILEDHGDGSEAASANGVTGAAGLGVRGIDPEEGGDGRNEFPRNTDDFHRVADEAGSLGTSPSPTTVALHQPAVGWSGGDGESLDFRESLWVK